MTHPTRAAKAAAHARILDFLRANGTTGVTAATVAVLTGSTTSQARIRLDALVARRQAERIQDNGTVTYRAVAPTEDRTGGVEGHVG
ncbi:hypothetical protein [Streptomyces sp. NPDC001537]